ncbi:DUF2252 domain-containing protein [Rhodococcus sp. NPDC127528]|uniref:DUF2252 domain-containing protein n=1 Tax=unclassified Rhodococcus (in: high G+C Gram-positive bacteria) TaxID=192944 RepID=UPI003633A36B
MVGVAFEKPEPADDRRRRGKALRARVPRGAHGEWQAPAGRPHPADVLDQQNAQRVPELVPLRYERMLVSPFTFLRGSAAIMAWDLAQGPRTDLMVAACGDAHLANFGLFAGPDRRLVFDVNDFDEVHRGPFEWDVKRLAVSVAVASEDNGHSAADARTAARTVAQTYREVMARATSMTALDVWYTRLEADAVIDQLRDDLGKRQLGVAEASMAKAERRTQLGSLERFARPTDGGFRLKEDPPLVVRLPYQRHVEVTTLLTDAYENYLATLATDRRQLVTRYRFQDIARKVVGVGSVGTMCFIALFIGDTARDPLFLQIKEAGQSVLAPYVEGTHYTDQGQRVVDGQRLIQSASDPFLGWFTGSGPLGRDFYVRQLRDKKGGFDIASMRPPGMQVYARLCATALARAHARTGDPVAISGYLGSGTVFDGAIERWAAAYAEQNRSDYHEVRLRRSGAVAGS